MNKNSKEKINVEQVNEVISLSRKILHVFYIAMLFAIVFIVSIIIKDWGILTFIFQFLKVLSPLFIGFVIAWLFNPLVKKLENQGIPKIAGAVLIYLVFIFVLIILLRVLIPTIFIQVNELISNLPSIFNDIKIYLSGLFDKIGNVNGLEVSNIETNVMNTLENGLAKFTTSFPTTLLNILGSFFSSLVTIVMGLFIGLYMLFDFDKISTHFLNLIPKKNQFEIKVLLDNIGGEVRKTVNSTLLVASMVFVCDSIGFAIVGLQAPLLFGLFCGLTDLIPYVGPYIGGAIAVIIGFSQNSFIGIMTLLICVVVQCVENFILQPIVMSKTMKLHPVTILVGLLIFNNLFGIIGMIFATPCIALLKVIWQFIQNKYELFKA